MAEDPLLRQDIPKVMMEIVREEGRGAMDPLAYLPGKFAPVTCTVERKGESKLSVPEPTLPSGFGVIWARQAQFPGREKAGGLAGKKQLQVAFEINKAIKLLLFPSVNGNSS